VLILVDESSGVVDPVYAALEGSLGVGFAILIAVGNPNVPRGWFFDSFHKHRKHWGTLTVSYKDITRDRERVEQWATGMIERYGEKHPWVQIKVFGQFPELSERGLIALSWLEEAGYPDRAKELKSTDGPRVVGVDVARFGSSRSVIGYAIGASLTRIDKHHGLSVPQLAGLVVRACHEHSADVCVIDGDGIGGGVCDLVRKKAIRVIEWHGNGSARDKKKYLNARSELHWLFREQLEIGNLAVIDDDDVQAQATGIEYNVNEDGLIVVEKKEQIIAKLGFSPDEFDAVLYTMAPYLLGSAVAPGSEGKKPAIPKPIKPKGLGQLPRGPM
jgi:hypothetical protein